MDGADHGQFPSDLKAGRPLRTLQVQEVCTRQRATTAGAGAAPGQNPRGGPCTAADAPASTLQLRAATHAGPTQDAAGHGALFSDFPPPHLPGR